MLRRNWVWSNLLPPRSQPARLSILSVGLVLILLAACTPLATPFPAPTLTAPVRASAVPPVAQPTPTMPVDIPLPPDVPLLPSDISLDAALSARLRDDLAAETGFDAADIRLVSIERGEWRTERLGCSTTPSEVVTTGTSVQLLAGQHVYTYHLSGAQMQRCDNAGEIVHGELLMQIDPVALEMVLLAQQQVAQTLDLSSRRVRLVDVRAYTWADTSLGCPLPEQAYTAREINGYRVVVAAGDETFAFHTDSQRLVPCEAGREVLPA